MRDDMGHLGFLPGRRSPEVPPSSCSYRIPVVVSNVMLIVFLVEGLLNTAVVLTENKCTPTPFEVESGLAAYMTELWMKLC